LQRLTAILFLLILVFNFCGYKLVISSQQREAAIAIENKVDKNQYTDDELISIKTTLHLPYYTSSSGFERVYGSVTINGIDYEYVKRRVYNDTLELLCLPNAAKTVLKTLSNNIAKVSASEQCTTPSKKGSITLKINFPVFCQSIKSTTEASVDFTKEAYMVYNMNLLPTDYTSLPERPPQSQHVIS
jgi:hypothetical protein